MQCVFDCRRIRRVHFCLNVLKIVFFVACKFDGLLLNDL